MTPPGRCGSPEGPARPRRAQLLVVKGERPGRRVSLDAPVVIGRSQEAGLQIDDGEISRRHARVYFQAGVGFVLEDLGSRNGTHLRGRPVTREPLELGDEFVLGGQSVLRLIPRDPGEDQLLEQQRLLAVGRLAAGVAHDVANMMGAVAGNVDWLRGLPAGSSLTDVEVQASLADVAAAVIRASELMRSVIGFARGYGQGRELVDLSALVAEVLRLLRHALGREIEVETVIDPGVLVLGDRAELHQVVMNLLLNARDAMPEGGRLSVEVALVGAASSVNGGLDSGALRASIVVRDSGHGMTPAIRARIFERFFSTKGQGLGFGLGLTTVQELVVGHGGKVEVETAPDQGSCFRVLLPARFGRARSSWLAATRDDVREPVGLEQLQGALVLIVDDEAVVQRSLARVLRGAGFEVQLASGGQQALERYFEGPRRPRLLLLDLDMPGWSGEQTLAELLARDPKARVVVMSGDPERVGAVTAAAGTLEKPCDARTLLAVARGALVAGEDEGPTAPG